MSGLEKLIVAGENQSITFGNHLATEKQKMDNFELGGDIYKVKTHSEVTHLEKNGRLLYESIPGTTVKNLVLNSDSLTFTVESGAEDAQVTVELEAEQEYKVFMNDVQVGKVKSNLAGKISFSVDFEHGEQRIAIKKI